MYKKILSFIIVVCCILTFFGCGNEESDTVLDSNADSVSMVIMLGNHANSKDHNVPYADSIRNVYECFGNVGVVVVDGDPEAVLTEDKKYLGFRSEDEIIELKENAQNNSDLWQQDTDKEIDALCEKIIQLKADSSEVNTLKAFRESLKLLNLMENDNKAILVHDTGLCTTGVLDFTKNNYFEMSTSEINEYIASLIEKSEIPDFAGITVKWYGIGDVNSPQKELQEWQKEKLKDIWYSIITSSGGTVEFVDIPSNGAHDVDQEVSTVDLPDSEPISLLESTTDSDMMVLTNIFFNGDSDVYKNSDNAEIALNHIKEEAEKDPESKWLIIGCSAGTTDMGVFKLSNHISAKRARKVKKELVDIGVSEDRLIMYSLGPYDPWHVSDSDGYNLIDEKAEFNRRVTIIRSDSTEAIMYKSIFEKGKLE